VAHHRDVVTADHLLTRSTSVLERSSIPEVSDDRRQCGAVTPRSGKHRGEFGFHDETPVISIFSSQVR
jgi:hypothetical protein